MHDIKFIRTSPEAFDEGLRRRGLPPQAKDLLALDEGKRAKQTELQELLSKRNQFAKQIGEAKRKGEDVAALMEDSKRLNDSIAAMEKEVSDGGPLVALLETLPNLPAADVPEGKDETHNKQLRIVGEKPKLDFAAKLHDELGEKLGLMDFAAAAKISGARFVVLKGALARMERALASFFLDHNIAAGYMEVAPPFMVRDNAVYGTGQLPKFKDDLFVAYKERDVIERTKIAVQKTHERIKSSALIVSEESMAILKEETENASIERFWLIPTAEVPLTNLVADEILEEEKLPLRMTAYTPCFRSEAGAAGKDTRGMIRQHQFSKVEMVSITHPDQSKAEHERMTECAESILTKLGLHFRTMLLCSGDMGFSAEKTYDIEVWMPGQNAYREISSCSNCGAFQARRMKARFKPKGGKGTEFVHTLNGSGLPIGRTMVAIMENYQNADGSISVPEALQPYMGGLKKIA